MPSFYQTERALSFWSSGEDMSVKLDDNGKQKLTGIFGELEWGTKTHAWSQSTCRLTAEMWKVITAEATLRSKKLPQDEAYGEDMEEDPRGMLEL